VAPPGALSADHPASAATERPRVGISRCLLGGEVRYDGRHKLDAPLLQALGPHVEWVPVCPEVEVGMGTPREPIELVDAPDGVPSGPHRVRLVGVSTRRDWTDAMDRWRRNRVQELRQEALSGFVLKQDSPSCGLDGVRVYSSEHVADDGRGLFAQALLDAFPGLPLEEEGRLRDRQMRDAFLARVLSYHRERWQQNGR